VFTEETNEQLILLLALRTLTLIPEKLHGRSASNTYFYWSVSIIKFKVTKHCSPGNEASSLAAPLLHRPYKSDVRDI